MATVTQSNIYGEIIQLRERIDLLEEKVNRVVEFIDKIETTLDQMGPMMEKVAPIMQMFAGGVIEVPTSMAGVNVLGTSHD